MQILVDCSSETWEPICVLGSNGSPWTNFSVSTGVKIGDITVTPEYVGKGGYDRIQFKVDASGTGVNHRDFNYFLEHNVVVSNFNIAKLSIYFKLS